jgi:hypothetical protein
MLSKSRTITNNVVAESQPANRAREQCPQPLLALDERQRGRALAVQVEKVEDNEHQVIGVTLVHRSLKAAERRHTVRTQRAQFAVEISRLRRQSAKNF